MSNPIPHGEGVVTNPTEQPDLEPQFAAGDIVCQPAQAPHGYRYEVVEDRGAIVVARAVSQYVIDEDGTSHLEPVSDAPETELNGRKVALAEDDPR